MAKQSPDPTLFSSQPSNEPHFRDYLQASADASKRGRAVVVLLVVTSVLVLAGLLNSLQHQWMLGRMHGLAIALNPAEPDNVQAAQLKTVLNAKIGEFPRALTERGVDDSEYKMAVDLYFKRYMVLYQEYAHQYAESAFLIRVPFFGVTFDVNDLGLIGGISMTALLLLLAFALWRERANLEHSFSELHELGRHQARAFYQLLAMNQVFTIPQMREADSEASRRPKRKILLWLPKAACAFPATVQFFVVIHDFYTFDLGALVSDFHATFVMLCETVIWVIMVIITKYVIRVLKDSDGIWAALWEVVKTAPAGVPASSITEVPLPSSHTNPKTVTPTSSPSSSLPTTIAAPSENPVAAPRNS